MRILIWIITNFQHNIFDNELIQRTPIPTGGPFREFGASFQRWSPHFGSVAIPLDNWIADCCRDCGAGSGDPDLGLPAPSDGVRLALADITRDHNRNRRVDLKYAKKRIILTF